MKRIYLIILFTLFILSLGAPGRIHAAENLPPSSIDPAGTDPMPVVFIPALRNHPLEMVNKRIAAGYFHTCAVTPGGAVKCWGSNGFGQLGNGTYQNSLVPVTVNGLASGVVEIASGLETSCALTSVGGVKCWGRNEYGLLGLGTKTRSRNYPVDVIAPGSGVKAIAMGSLTACIITNKGGVKCWGMQPGSSTPVDVPGLSQGVAAITVGGTFSCALTLDGLVTCWQRKTGGGLTTYEINDFRQPLLSLSMPMQYGWLYSICGVTILGTVECDSHYQGFITLDISPNMIDPAISAVAVSGRHACVLSFEGAVKCWGNNEDGCVGDGTTTDRDTPVDVVGLGSGAIQLSAGEDHNCAMTAEGRVKCWGSNSLGQLGTGQSQEYSTTPKDVVQFP